MQNRIDDYDRDELWKDSVAANRTELGMRDWVDSIDESEKRDIVADPSYITLFLDKMQEINPEIAYSDCI